MKKGFTMIELIFVIVILGILASVAIPRLAGTREDAEISTAIANLRTLLSDASSYHVAKGSFDGAKWKDLTNVPLKKADGNAIDAAAGAVGNPMYIAVGSKNCLQVGIRDSDISAYISFQPDATNKNDNTCATFLATDTVKQLLDSTLPASSDPNRNYCRGANHPDGGIGCIDITPSSIY